MKKFDDKKWFTVRRGWLCFTVEEGSFTQSIETTESRATAVHREHWVLWLLPLENNLRTLDRTHKTVLLLYRAFWTDLDSLLKITTLVILRLIRFAVWFRVGNRQRVNRKSQYFAHWGPFHSGQRSVSPSLRKFFFFREEIITQVYGTLCGNWKDMAELDGNDKDRILEGDGTVRKVREKKKKKKAKNSNSNDHLPFSERQNGGILRQVSSNSNGEQPKRVQLALEPVASREQLIQIHEELNSPHPISRAEINRDEKDLRKLALHLAMSKSEEGKNSKYLHHDYVLVHRTGDNRNLHEKLRKKFEAELHLQGFRVERKYTSNKTFVILHCSFERLCEEAEHVSLEMPLAGVSQSISIKQPCLKSIHCLEKR